MTTMTGRLESQIQEDHRSEIFTIGCFFGFIFGVVLGLIFMTITLFIGFSLKATIIFSIISGLFFFWLTWEIGDLLVLLGCSAGSAFATLAIFCLRAGLKQGLYAGAINFLTICVVSFCIIFLLIIWDICSDLYYKYRK